MDSVTSSRYKLRFRVIGLFVSTMKRGEWNESKADSILLSFFLLGPFRYYIVIV